MSSIQCWISFLLRFCSIIHKPDHDFERMNHKQAQGHHLQILSPGSLQVSWEAKMPCESWIQTSFEEGTAVRKWLLNKDVS